jgi:ADP-heptose:LPS heptosyltransferase
LGGRPYAVINPGGRLAGRRIPESEFAAAARALLQTGLIPVVTWGPGEEEMARLVCQGAPGAVRAPPTDIHALASLMKLSTLTVCNNTGPMHLSVAVGTPTLAFFIHLNPLRWGHGDPPHRFADITSLLSQGSRLDAEVEAQTREFSLAVRRH